MLFLLLLLILVLPVARAKLYTIAWTFGTTPSLITIEKFDTVSFVWEDETHDVVRLADPLAYKACSKNTAMYPVIPATLSANVTFRADMLGGVGTHHYVCSVAYSTHCQAGVKVQINITNGGKKKSKKKKKKKGLTG